MNTKFSRRTAPASALAAVLLIVAITPAVAVTNVFFSSSQTTNLLNSGVTSDTISSEGYLFTVTRDKLFTGGVGLTNPIGRTIRIPLPTGLEAQAVTAGPSPGGAKIVIKRQDGQVFDVLAFSARLLANTAGAGAAFEIMPLLNGEDGAPDPFMFNATGYAGSQFTYATPGLAGFDEYKITLYVDFALMSLATVDDSPPPPRLDMFAGATSITIRWAIDATAYILESTTNLPSAAWTAVTNEIVPAGDLLTVEWPKESSQRFFRLRK
jgi:hypothetical protein